MNITSLIKSGVTVTFCGILTICKLSSNQNVKDLFNFSEAAYNDPNSQVRRLELVQKGWAIHNFEAQNEFINGHQRDWGVAGYNREAKMVVIGYHGTEDAYLDAWCTNLAFSKITLEKFGLNGKAHAGFYKGVCKSLKSLFGALSHIYTTHFGGHIETLFGSLGDGPDIRDYQDNMHHYYLKGVTILIAHLSTEHNLKFHLTGHSLGGAYATLFNAAILGTAQKMGLSINSQVATFGAPKVFDREASAYYNTVLGAQATTDRYVFHTGQNGLYSGDPVAAVLATTFLGYEDVGTLRDLDTSFARQMGLKEWKGQFLKDLDVFCKNASVSENNSLHLSSLLSTIGSAAVALPVNQFFSPHRLSYYGKMATATPSGQSLVGPGFRKDVGNAMGYAAQLAKGVAVKTEHAMVMAAQQVKNTYVTAQKMVSEAAYTAYQACSSAFKTAVNYTVDLSKEVYNSLESLASQQAIECIAPAVSDAIKIIFGGLNSVAFSTDTMNRDTCR